MRQEEVDVRDKGIDQTVILEEFAIRLSDGKRKH